MSRTRPKYPNVTLQAFISQAVPAVAATSTSPVVPPGTGRNTYAGRHVSGCLDNYRQ